MRNAISLASLLAALSATPPVLAQPVGYEGTPISTTVYVSFANGSARFRPTGNDTSALTSAVDAALVSIRGRTSTDTPSARDEALALARAIGARSYLVAHGVSPLKITLNYASAADFITDNATPDARRQNQRVEIDIIHVTVHRTAEEKLERALTTRHAAVVVE